jgi:hypothetical protein
MNDPNVIALPASTSFKPAQALHSALQAGDKLTDVLVIGYVDGELFIRSSHMTRAEALFLSELARRWAIGG